MSSLIDKIRGKVLNRPSREEVIFNTGLRLDKLKKKYEKYLLVQRRIVNGNPTPREKEIAESKIRSALCAYTICTEASRRLDEIATDDQLASTLSELNGALRTVNRLGKSRAAADGAGISKGTEKLFGRDQDLKVENLFSDEALAAVDSWLGSKWSDVAQKYINGANLMDCMRDSKMVIENENIPNLYGNAFDGDDGTALDDLLKADLF